MVAPHRTIKQPVTQKAFSETESTCVHPLPEIHQWFIVRERRSSRWTRKENEKKNEQNKIKYTIWAVFISEEDKEQSQTLWLTLLAPSWREDGEDQLLKRYNVESAPQGAIPVFLNSIYAKTKVKLQKCASLFTVIIIPHRNKEHEFVTRNLFTSSH